VARSSETTWATVGKGMLRPGPRKWLGNDKGMAKKDKGEKTEHAYFFLTGEGMWIADSFASDLAHGRVPHIPKRTKGTHCLTTELGCCSATARVSSYRPSDRSHTAPFQKFGLIIPGPPKKCWPHSPDLYKPPLRPHVPTHPPTLPLHPSSSSSSTPLLFNHVQP